MCNLPYKDTVAPKMFALFPVFTLICSLCLVLRAVELWAGCGSPCWPLVVNGRLHALELIDTLFGVSRTDLPQRFVFVTPGSHVLCMDDVVLRFLRLVTSVSQLRAQSLTEKQKEERQRERAQIKRLSHHGPKPCSGILPLVTESIYDHDV